MPTPISIKIFAVKYDGNFISQVRAIQHRPENKPQAVELTREQMLAALKDGVTLEAVSSDQPDGVTWGRIEMVNDEGTEYFALNDLNTGLDDLGDLPDHG